MIGWAGYQRATFASARAARTRLALFHMCHEVMASWMAENPHGVAIWRGDHGNDGDQYDRARSPQSEAQRFADRFIVPYRALLRPGTIVLGPNEYTPGPFDREHWLYRAQLELALCHIVQNEMGLLYGALSCAGGNLDPSMLGPTAEVFRQSYCVNYHGYLEPRRRTLAEEVTPFYLYRPLVIWQPMLADIGVTHWRLLLGECGTWTAPGTLGLNREDEVRVCLSIESEMARRCAGTGVQWIGGCAYGYGMMGEDGSANDQRPWELAGTEHLLAQATLESGGEVMTLVQQYPVAFAEWETAGGIETNFRDHLLGLQALPSDNGAMRHLISQTRAKCSQLQGVLANRPYQAQGLAYVAQIRQSLMLLEAIVPPA